MNMINDGLSERTGNTYILPKKLTAEAVINKALWTTFYILIIAVFATFFVEDVPNVIVDARQIAIDGLWLMLCSFSIGELVKQIYRNKGRETKEYKDAKASADEALIALTTDELYARTEYCKEYENNEYMRSFECLLATAGLSKDEYQQYVAMSKRELKRCKQKLSRLQVNSIYKLNNLTRIHYDPSFFLYGFHDGGRLSPSEMYDAEARNRNNTIKSVFFTIAGSLCATSMAGSIIFSFSQAALIAAVIKITTIIIFSYFKAVFGWNLSMRTEMGRYAVTVKECNALKAWHAKRQES